MKTILVTGAYGQLGNEIKLLSGNERFAQFEFLFTDIDTLDITSRKYLEEYFSEHRIDYIINCAAYTAVDKAETDASTATLVNVTAVSNLAWIAEKYNTKIVHISTDYVFDGNAHLPYKENDIPNPASVYGNTKYFGEQELIHSSVDYTIIRTSWLYSSFGNNFVKTILRIGRERKSLNVVDDQVGSPTYACDLAWTVLDIICKTSAENLDLNGEIYHYSNEGVCSWYDFAIEIVRMSGLSCRVNPIETRDYPLPAKRPFYSLFNKSKIKSAFSLTIPYWKDSLEKCLEKLK
ncbi:MAG: dTDP-4-dehydrorhamnose reductase [Bacteroidia bacterium]|nr:dTDP-4-dehydrorhamnose reductase [Bacteroidia bacterium]